MNNQYSNISPNHQHPALNPNGTSTVGQPEPPIDPLDSNYLHRDRIIGHDVFRPAPAAQPQPPPAPASANEPASISPPPAPPAAAAPPLHPAQPDSGSKPPNPEPQPDLSNFEVFLSSFPPFQGETPRAHSAFQAYFNLGHARSLQATADLLSESIDAIKRWSSRFHWARRIQSFNAAILQHQAQTHAAFQTQHSAAQAKRDVDWAERINATREDEWIAARHLHSTGICFLQNVGDDEIKKMTLGQVSRAIAMSSKMRRDAIAGVELPGRTAPQLSDLQKELLESLKRVYGVDDAALENPKL